MVSCNTTCFCCVFKFCLLISSKWYFCIYACCENLVATRGAQAVQLWFSCQCYRPRRAAKLLWHRDSSVIPTPQLWEEASWQGQLRQTLLGQPRTQPHVQSSPADSWVWGLGKTVTICLWTTPWAPCPISFQRCVCQVAISLRKISIQFLGLRRQAILDLHSLECYIRLVYYVTFTSHILQLHLRKIQNTVNRITITNYVLHNTPNSRENHKLFSEWITYYGLCLSVMN